MKKLFVVLMLAFSISIPAYALTLTEMRVVVRDTVGDPSTTASKQRWSDAKLNTLINQGQREIAEATWCLYLSTNITMVSGTTYYSMPSDFQFIDRVIYNRSTILPEKPIPQLDREDSDWLATAINTPTSYHVEYPKRRIGFSPCPNNTNNMEIFYVRVATDLSADGDIPFNSIEMYYSYHHLLITYASAYIFFREEKLQQYEAFNNKVEIGIGKMMRHLGLVNKKESFMRGGR